MTIFHDILGHENVKRGLQHAMRTGRLHHALLLTGPAGIGKAMVGRAFIQAMMCEKSTLNAPVRCGICSSCLRIMNKNHPDVIEIEESAATIKIDTIREIQRGLVSAPFESARRFVMIHDVHKMQDAAANCLLKTLEEPDAYTTFLLVTSQEQRLLSTIISRCQVVRFAAFSLDEVAQFLIQHEVPKEMAGQIAALSGGSLGAAIDLSNGEYKTEVLGTFEEMIGTSSVMDAFAVAASLKGKKAMAEHLLTLLSMYVRDMMVLKADPKSPVILEHYREHILQRVDKVSDKHLNRAANTIQEVHESFLGNVNELVAWERLLVMMYGVLF